MALAMVLFIALGTNSFVSAAAPKGVSKSKPPAKAKATQDSEDPSIAVNNAGVHALEAKEYAKAESLFLQALAIDPDYTYARGNLAIAYDNRGIEQFRSGDLSGALNSMYKSYLLEPGSIQGRQNLIAITTKHDPGSKDSPKSREPLANYWMDSGEYLYALIEFEMLELAAPSDELKKRIVTAYEEAKLDFPNLIKLHEKAYPRLVDIVRVEKGKTVSAQPIKPDVWSKLDRLIVKRQYAKAIDELSKYLTSHPSDVRALQRRGRAYYFADDFVKAEIDAKKVIEMDDKSVDGHELLSSVLQEQKNYDQALVEVNKAIELSPDADVLYNQRASIYRDQSKEDLSKADYDKAKMLKDAGKTYIVDGCPKNVDMEVYNWLIDALIRQRLGELHTPEQQAAIAKLPQKLYVSSVSYEITRDGRIINLKLKESCGEALVDQIIVDMLKDQKFLRLPPGYPRKIPSSFKLAYNTNDKPATPSVSETK